MTLKIETFERVPFTVDVAMINEENMEEAAEWCNGKVCTVKRDDVVSKYIKVEVVRPASVRQTKAFVGDRILRTITGFRVYNAVAFANAFRPVVVYTEADAEAQLHDPYPPQPHATPESVSDQITAEDNDNPKSDLELQEIIETTETIEEDGYEGPDKVAFRDAVSGEYVTAEFATMHPSTTVSETEKVGSE